MPDFGAKATFPSPLRRQGSMTRGMSPVVAPACAAIMEFANELDASARRGQPIDRLQSPAGHKRAQRRAGFGNQLAINSTDEGYFACSLVRLASGHRSVLPGPGSRSRQAHSFLNAHLRVGDQLKPELMRGLQVEGFKLLRLSPDAERQIRHEIPWSDLLPSRLYTCSKSIPGRPAISVTDVQATLAIDKEKRILISFVRANRTSL